MKTKELKRAIDRVEEHFNRCWEILTSLHSPRIGELADLQPTLGKALLCISESYNLVRQHRKSLIKRKLAFSNRWFCQEQRRCGAMENALIQVRGIGLALGDSFVWPFFQNDIELFKAHAKHPNTDDLQPGIGGEGELKFVQTVPIIGEYLVIHHALTSVLRIGDVSLVDLRDFRVKGVGEIKTARTGEHECTATLYAVSRQKLPTFSKKRPAARTQPVMLPKQVDQLHRQLDRMTELIASGQKEKRIGGVELVVDSTEKKFEKLVLDATSSTSSAIAINDSLVCVATRCGSRSLHRACFRPPKVDYTSRLPNHLTDSVSQILLPDSRFNSVVISPFFYDATGMPWPRYDTIPLFWWRMDLEAIRRIVFRETVVTTIFNPAPLIERLLSAGFTVERGKRVGHFEVQKEVAGKFISVHGIELLTDLIKQAFFSASEVAEMITETVNAAQAAGVTHGRVSMNLKQMDARFPVRRRSTVTSRGN
jgi:hypothetical protein